MKGLPIIMQSYYDNSAPPRHRHGAIFVASAAILTLIMTTLLTGVFAQYAWAQTPQVPQQKYTWDSKKEFKLENAIPIDINNLKVEGLTKDIVAVKGSGKEKSFHIIDKTGADSRSIPGKITVSWPYKVGDKTFTMKITADNTKFVRHMGEPFESRAKEQGKDICTPLIMISPVNFGKKTIYTFRLSSFGYVERPGWTQMDKKQVPKNCYIHHDKEDREYIATRSIVRSDINFTVWDGKKNVTGKFGLTQGFSDIDVVKTPEKQKETNEAYNNKKWSIVPKDANGLVREATKVYPQSFDKVFVPNTWAQEIDGDVFYAKTQTDLKEFSKSTVFGRMKENATSLKSTIQVAGAATEVLVYTSLEDIDLHKIHDSVNKKRKVGDKLQYRVTTRLPEGYVNGFTPYHHVVLKDTLPDGVIHDKTTILIDDKQASSNVGKLNVSGKTVTYTFDHGWLSHLDNMKGQKVHMIIDTHIDPKFNKGRVGANTVFADINEVIKKDFSAPPVDLDEDPRISIVKKANVDKVFAGDLIDYTISVSSQNSSWKKLTNVAISDSWDKALEWTDDSTVTGLGKYTKTDTGFNGVLPEISGGQTKTITVTNVRVKDIQALQAVNTVFVDIPNNKGESSSKTNTPIVPPGLTIAKGVSAEHVYPGDKLDYIIEVGQGVKGATSYGTTLTDIIPKGLVLVDGSVNVDGEKVDYDYDKENNHLVIDLGNVSELRTITYQVEAEKQLSKQTLINKATAKDRHGNKATVTTIVNTDRDWPVVTEEGTTENGDPLTEAEVPVNLTPPELTIAKGVNTDTARPGDTLHYLVEVGQKQQGSTSYGVVMTDILPQGLSLVDDSVAINGEKAKYEYNKDKRELIVNLGDVSELVSVTYDTVVDANTKLISLINKAHAVDEYGNTARVTTVVNTKDYPVSTQASDTSHASVKVTLDHPQPVAPPQPQEKQLPPMPPLAKTGTMIGLMVVLGLASIGVGAAMYRMRKNNLE